MKHAAFSLAAAEALGPPADGRLSTGIFGHGSLEVRLYQPRGEDRQTPHPRDEAYVVAAGSAVLVCAESRHVLDTGGFAFVAAGEPHRFERISDDFAVWVLFYGPDGGEEHGAG